jgi:hypothetical protein
MLFQPVWLPTVYNGYPIELYPFVEKPQPKHPSWLKNGYPLGNKSKDSTNHSEDGTEYLAFLGRFSSDKGAHNAIEIALKASMLSIFFLFNRLWIFTDQKNIVAYQGCLGLPETRNPRFLATRNSIPDPKNFRPTRIRNPTRTFWRPEATLLLTL